MKPLLYSVLARPTHPTRDGAAIRNYHLLLALAGRFRVRAFALRAPHLEAGAAQYPPGIDVEEFPQSSRTWRRASAAAASVVFGGAYSARLYRAPALDRRLAALVPSERPAWVVAHSYHVAPLALEKGRPAWIDFHNLDSQIWSRLGDTAFSAPVRAFAALQARRVAAFERAIVGRARGVSCVSSPDAGALLRLEAGAAPIVVPNGVDLGRYDFVPGRPGNGTLLFVGDLSWPPNAEALRWFAAEVWPLIRASAPAARVEILGRGAPPDLQRRAPEWRFLGEGGDTRPHWQRADVAIVPLRAGGGTRLKILEAAACGVPVVSTRIGAEGLDLEPGREILVQDDAPDFANAAVRLLQEPSLREAVAAAGRARVERRYDWTRIGSDFADELLARSLA